MSRLSPPRSPEVPAKVPAPESSGAESSSSASRETRRVTRVEPNLLLDPHGMSGTATARRLRASRRRRQWQMIALAALGALLLGFGGWLLRPREAVLEWQRAATLPFSPATPAVASNDSLWVAARDGALWNVDLASQNASHRLGGGAWPARVAPTLSDQHAFFAAPDGEVWAWNAATHRPAWRRTVGGSLGTRPLVAGRALLVGDDAGRLVALDAQTGKNLWSAQAGGPLGQELIAARSGGTATVIAPTLAATGSRGGLRCFDAQTGRAIWRFPAEARAGAAGLCAPVFETRSNRIYWANDEGAAFALDADTGRKIWKTFARPLALASGKPSPVVLRGAPVLANENLIVGGNDGAVRAFEARDGRAKWTTFVGGPVLHAVLLLDEDPTNRRVLVSGGDDIVVLDARDGRVLRRGAVPGLVGLTRARNQIWALSDNGTLWRLKSF